jgi:hypothetical protein
MAGSKAAGMEQAWSKQWTLATLRAHCTEM